MPIDLRPTTLEGTHIRLEPLSLSHHSRLCEIGLDEALWKSTIIKVADEEEMLHYIQHALTEQASGTCVPLCDHSQSFEQNCWYDPLPQHQFSSVKVGDWLHVDCLAVAADRCKHRGKILIQGCRFISGRSESSPDVY